MAYDPATKTLHADLTVYTPPIVVPGATPHPDVCTKHCYTDAAVRHAVASFAAGYKEEDVEHFLSNPQETREIIQRSSDSWNKKHEELWACFVTRNVQDVTTVSFGMLEHIPCKECAKPVPIDVFCPPFQAACKAYPVQVHWGRPCECIVYAPSRTAFGTVQIYDDPVEKVVGTKISLYPQAQSVATWDRKTLMDPILQADIAAVHDKSHDRAYYLAHPDEAVAVVKRVHGESMRKHRGEQATDILVKESDQENKMAIAISPPNPHLRAFVNNTTNASFVIPPTSRINTTGAGSNWSDDDVPDWTAGMDQHFQKNEELQRKREASLWMPPAPQVSLQGQHNYLMNMKQMKPSVTYCSDTFKDDIVKKITSAIVHIGDEAVKSCPCCSPEDQHRPPSPPPKPLPRDSTRFTRAKGKGATVKYINRVLRPILVAFITGSVKLTKLEHPAHVDRETIFNWAWENENVIHSFFRGHSNDICTRQGGYSYNETRDDVALHINSAALQKYHNYATYIAHPEKALEYVNQKEAKEVAWTIKHAEDPANIPDLVDDYGRLWLDHPEDSYEALAQQFRFIRSTRTVGIAVRFAVGFDDRQIESYEAFSKLFYTEETEEEAFDFVACVQRMLGNSIGCYQMKVEWLEINQMKADEIRFDKVPKSSKHHEIVSTKSEDWARIINECVKKTAVPVGVYVSLKQ